MRSIRVLFVLGGAAVVAAAFAQAPAQAYGHGHGAFATPGSRTRARTYARRAYTRAPARTYASTPRYVQRTYTQPRTVYSTATNRAPTYNAPTYNAPTYNQVDYRQASRPTAAMSERRMVDRNGNVWIERRPAARTTYVAPQRTAAYVPPPAPRYVQPTYVASAPRTTTRSSVEYDGSGRPWIRRYTTTSPAPAAGAGLGSAVRSLRAARESSERIAPGPCVWTTPRRCPRPVPTPRPARPASPEARAHRAAVSRPASMNGMPLDSMPVSRRRRA